MLLKRMSGHCIVKVLLGMLVRHVITEVRYFILHFITIGEWDLI